MNSAAAPTAVSLKPGETHMADGPSVVVTVLGSCVSVTLFHRRSRAGAISHSLLPRCLCRDKCGGDCRKCVYGAPCAGNCGDSSRYTDCSIRTMVAWFDERGVPRRELEVKLFGGSDMFRKVNGRGKAVTVGRQNIIIAKRVLEAAGLSLSRADTGGMRGRKIIFHTHTGEVLLKRLRKMKAGEDGNE